eukprot:gene6891-5116_t
MKKNGLDITGLSPCNKRTMADKLAGHWQQVVTDRFGADRVVWASRYSQRNVNERMCGYSVP